MLKNEDIANAVEAFVRNTGPKNYLMREMIGDPDRLFLSQYADHEHAEIIAMKTAEGHTIIYVPERQMIRNPRNFNRHEFLCALNRG